MLEVMKKGLFGFLSECLQSTRGEKITGKGKKGLSSLEW